MNEYHNLAPLTQMGRRCILTAASLLIALILLEGCSRLL